MNGLKVKLMSNTPNLASMYEAYANGTLEEYCTEHDLDFVLVNMVMKHWPTALAHGIIHGWPTTEQVEEITKNASTKKED